MHNTNALLLNIAQCLILVVFYFLTLNSHVHCYSDMGKLIEHFQASEMHRC